MAYMCRRVGNRECDGCGDCKPKETGVTITATLEMKFVVYGDIETMMRLGMLDRAERKAEEIMEDAVSHIDNMSLKEVNIELNE